MDMDCCDARAIEERTRKRAPAPCPFMTGDHVVNSSHDKIVFWRVQMQEWFTKDRIIELRHSCSQNHFQESSKIRSLLVLPCSSQTWTQEN